MGGKAHAGRRITAPEARELFRELKCLLLSSTDCGVIDEIVVAGSIGRGEPEGGDLDLLVQVSGSVDVALTQLFGTLKNGKPAKSGLYKGVQVDVLLCDKESRGAAELFLMGPAEKNIQQRCAAKMRGMLLNEKGLFDRQTGVRVTSGLRDIEALLGELHIVQSEEA